MLSIMFRVSVTTETAATPLSWDRAAEKPYSSMPSASRTSRVVGS